MGWAGDFLRVAPLQPGKSIAYYTAVGPDTGTHRASKGRGITSLSAGFLLLPFYLEG